jgi:molecular chaperone Hsp33
VSDYLVRALAGGESVRAFACVTTRLTDEARQRHGTYPTATAALGRALAAVALLGATLKDGGSLTLRIAGDGPLGGIVADGDHQGRVRGYVKNPQTDPDQVGGKLDVGSAVGRNGFIHVTRDLGLKELYTGSVGLVSGEIAEDLTQYLTISEQLPSAVALGVLIGPEGDVRAAGGYMLQVLPAVTDEERTALEENLRRLGSVSRTIDAGATPEAMLEEIFRSVAYRITERRELRFACRCSRARALDSLAVLSPEDLEQMIRDDGGAELTCQFCNEIYRFSAADLQGRLDERGVPR